MFVYLRVLLISCTCYTVVQKHGCDFFFKSLPTDTIKYSCNFCAYIFCDVTKNSGCTVLSG
jgi:hypothetical protein